MAVIESKGDGYALYNGVKLPDINTVWTDKETYPYAFIGQQLSDGQILCISKSAGFYKESTKVYTFNQTAKSIYCKLVDGVWTVVSSGAFTNLNNVTEIEWTNFDVINYDNSLYLAASAPIPLDGMNVIEWDGVTDGLEVFAEGYYKIADFSPASAGVVVSEISGSDTPDVVSYFGELQGTAGSWAIAGGSTSKPVVYGIHEEDATTADVSAGIYAKAYHGTFPDGGTVSVWASIIAYTPATEEPEDTSKKDFWNGVACGLCGSGTPNFSDTSPFGVGYITGCKLRALREKKEPVYE